MQEHAAGHHQQAIEGRGHGPGSTALQAEELVGEVVAGALGPDPVVEDRRRQAFVARCREQGGALGRELVDGRVVGERGAATELGNCALLDPRGDAQVSQGAGCVEQEGPFGGRQ